MDWVDQGRVPMDQNSPLPQTALRTLLTSIKLLALRVNVFHIKNILKQNAGHGKRATRVAQGAERATTTRGTRTPSRGENEGREGTVVPEEQR